MTDTVTQPPMDDFDAQMAAAGAQATRARVAAEHAELDENNTRADVAVAQELQRFADHRLTFTQQGWFVWDGKYWKKDVGQQRILIARELALDIWRRVAEGAPNGEQLLERARQLQRFGGITAMFKIAEATMFRDIQQFDSQPHLLNCPNGTLDLNDVDEHGNPALNSHSPKDYLTRICPTPWDPEAHDDTWEKVLNENIDPVHLATIQQVFGMGVTGQPVKRLPIFKGPTNSGKTTLTSPMLQVLGLAGDDGYGAAWPSDMMEENGRVNRGERIANARGARLVLVAELKQNARMANDFIKNITGGDYVDAEGKYQKSFSYRPTYCLWLYTNFIPTSRDPALHRRLLILPMTRVPTVLDARVLSHLTEETRAHSAILRWTVAGCLALKKNNWDFGQLPWHDKILHAYVSDSDPVVRFLDDTCERTDDINRWVHTEELYSRYFAWTVKEGVKALGSTNFAKAVAARNIEKVRVTRNGEKAMVWDGLALQNA